MFVCLQYLNQLSSPEETKLLKRVGLTQQRQRIKNHVAIKIKRKSNASLPDSFCLGMLVTWKRSNCTIHPRTPSSLLLKDSRNVGVNLCTAHRQEDHLISWAPTNCLEPALPTFCPLQSLRKGGRSRNSCLCEFDISLVISCPLSVFLLKTVLEAKVARSRLAWACTRKTKCLSHQPTELSEKPTGGGRKGLEYRTFHLLSSFCF